MTRQGTTMMLAVVIAAAGCGKTKAGDRASSSDHGSAGQVAKQPLTAAFFGKQVRPMGPLTRLRWGMTVAEAKQAAPELFSRSGEDLRPIADPRIDGVAYELSFDADTRRLDRFEVSVPASARALIAGAWGAGTAAEDPTGKPRTYWFDPAAGWRAYLAQGGGGGLRLVVQRYLPAARLLGDGSDTLGFAPKGIVGDTLADLRARFPDTLVEHGARQLGAQQKTLVGKDPDRQLGPATAEVELALPPTEWAEHDTTVHIDWGDDGKVEDVWFALAYGAHGPARDQLSALFDKKWGQGEPIEFLGDKGWRHRDHAPYAIITDDTTSHAWDVRITSVKP